MNDSTLHILEVVHELTIIGGDPVVEILEIAAQGPPGRDGASGLTAVVEDLDPHLGADLIMNGFQIKGQAETSDLVIDGGLL